MTPCSYLQMHHPENIAIPAIRNKKFDSAGRCTCGLLAVSYRRRFDGTFQPMCIAALTADELRWVRAEIAGAM